MIFRYQHWNMLRISGATLRRNVHQHFIGIPYLRIRGIIGGFWAVIDISHWSNWGYLSNYAEMNASKHKETNLGTKKSSHKTKSSNQLYFYIKFWHVLTSIYPDLQHLRTVAPLHRHAPPRFTASQWRCFTTVSGQRQGGQERTSQLDPRLCSHGLEMGIT